MNRPKSIERMIDSFRRLPSIGPKMAERLSYYILKAPDSNVKELVESIKVAREVIHVCERCYNLSEKNPCSICQDDSRDSSTVCVVETPQDLLVLSNVKTYRGLYFVLGGALSPLDGVPPIRHPFFIGGSQAIVGSR